MAAEGWVLFESRDEHLIAFGDVEIGGGGDISEVTQGSRECARCGFAFVYVQGSTIVESDAEIVIAAERVVPGKPVTQDGRFVREKRENRAQHLLVGAEHALGIDDSFGLAG